jgi:hypothetical protein
MNVNGSMTSRKTIPDTSTTMEKARPRSETKVISPNPRVDMTVRVQYRPVSQEKYRPSYSMMMWKSTL